MKRITKNIFAILVILLGTISCSDYLDQVPTDILTLEKAFESRESSMRYLASVYTYLPNEFSQREVCRGDNSQGTSGAWVGGCDEAEFVFELSGSGYQNINNGSFTPETYFIRDYWEKYYKGIRTATVFMDNLHLCKTLSPGDYDQWIAEARALRAIYYFYLFRLYGPVPIIDETISENAAIDALQIPRNSVEEVVDYILTELDEAMKSGLIENIKTSAQVQSKEKGLGHIDQAMARAYKLQTRMLAASPLFTGENSFYASLQNPDGKKLFPSYDAAKKKQLWSDAAKEAKEFIDKYVGNGYELTRKYTNGKLDPYLSYREAIRGFKSEMTNFDGSSSASEMVLFIERCGSGGMQYERTPKHFDARNQNGDGVSGNYKASSGMAATQEIVDSYFMANGKKPISGYESDKKTPIINKESGYAEDYNAVSGDYLDPVTGRVLAPDGTPAAWRNREPRFYADITFDGQIWLNTNEGSVRTGMQFSGNSGRGKGASNDYSKTGYIVRKSAPTGAWGENDRICILLRLAQIYLDYAEALNEADFNANKQEILKYVNLIRERAGIPGYGAGAVGGFQPLPEPKSQEEMRQAIRDERRVELAFECYRYFDIRRWCIAEQFENRPIHGMNINKDGDEFFVRTMVEERVFDKKNYFFPLPNKDIKINKNLVQNPGWGN